MMSSDSVPRTINVTTHGNLHVDTPVDRLSMNQVQNPETDSLIDKQGPDMTRVPEMAGISKVKTCSSLGHRFYNSDDTDYSMSDLDVGSNGSSAEFDGLDEQLCYDKIFGDSDQSYTLPEVETRWLELHPNLSLCAEFGVSLELAEYFWKKGDLEEEDHIAFDGENRPLTFSLIEDMLGRQLIQSFIDREKNKLKTKSVEKDRRLQEKIERNKKHIEKRLKKRIPEHLDSDYSYLAFLSNKKIYGNNRSKCIHPNYVRKLAIKLAEMDSHYVEDDIITESGMGQHSFMEVQGGIGYSGYGLGITTIKAWFQSIYGNMSELYPLFEHFTKVENSYINTTLVNLLIQVTKFVHHIVTVPTWDHIISAFHTLFTSLGLEYNEIIKEFKFSLALKDLTHVVTESASNFVEKASNVFHMIISSQLVSIIKDVMLLIASYKVFSKDTAKKVFAVLGESKPMTILEGISHGFSAVIGLLKCGDMINAKVPVMDVLLHKDPRSSLVEKLRILYGMRDLTTIGLPIAGKICRLAYMSDVKNALDTAAGIKKFMSKKDIAYKEITDYMIKLQVVLVGMQGMFAGLNRQTPYALMIVSGPGVGKSIFQEYCEKVFEMEMRPGRPYDPLDTYHFTIDSEYDEGYFSQPRAHISEPGNKSREIVMKTGDPSTSKLLSLVDGRPMSLNMSAAELKGKVWFQAQLVLMDTNNPGLHAKDLFYNEYAIYRRFKRVYISVLPDFRIDNSSQIDPQKSLESDADWYDKWKITVKSFVVTGTLNPNAAESETSPITGHSKTEFEGTIRGFTEWMRNDVRKHFEHQKGIQERLMRPDSDPWFYVDKDVLVIDGIEQKENFINTTLLDLKDHLVDQEVHTPCDEKEIVTEGNFLKDLFEPKKSNDFKADIDHSISSTEEDLKFLNTSDLDENFKNKIHIGEENVSGDSYWKVFTSALFVIYSGSLAGVVGSSFWCVLQYLHLSNFFCNTMSKRSRWIFSSVSSLGAITTLFIIWNPLIALLFASTAITINSPLPPVVITGLTIYFNKTRGKIFSLLDTGIGNLSYYSGHGYQDHLFSNFWKRNKDVLGPLILIVAVAASYKAYTRSKPKKKEDKNIIFNSFFPETETNFKLESDDNSKITKMEVDSHCGRSLKRVNKNGSKIWSVRHIVEPPKHKNTLESLQSAIARNTRRCNVGVPGDDGDTYIFGIQGAYALINRHCLGDLSKGVMIQVCETGALNPIQDQFKNTFLLEENLQYVTEDIVLVRLNQIKFRDVLEHFNDFEKWKGSVNGMIDGDLTRVEYLDEPLEVCNPHDKSIVKHKRTLTYKWKSHKAGKCGLPVSIEYANGVIIAGIHSAGWKKLEYSYAAIVTRPMLINAINKIQNPYMDILSEGNIVREQMFEPNGKSPFRYMPLFGAEYYGRIGGAIHFNNKSNLIKTSYSGKVKEILTKNNFIIDKEFGPPLMKHKYDQEGNYIHPINIGLEKITCEKYPLRDDLMNFIIKELVDRFKLPEVNPLELTYAINGDLDDDYLRRMNVSTSSGYGLSGNKGEHLPIVNTLGPLVEREPDAKLKNLIVKIYDAYLDGKSSEQYIKYILKDEPREMSKVLTGKTRLFGASSLAPVAVSRQYVGPFYLSMIANDSLFCTAIGIDMFKNGYKIKEKLLNWSKWIMGGDYSNYDQKMPFQISLAACTVVYRVLENCGYNHVALQMVKGILTESLFTNILMNNDLFQVPGVQPSGKYATAEDNSLKGLIMMMYAFYHKFGTETSFFDVILPVIYGDDVLAAVKESHKDEFNNIIYSKLCKELYGMDYTSVRKDGTLTEFESLEDMSFLKRKFVYKDDLKRDVTPLDINSIYRSLSWYLPSKSETKEQQALSALQSAMYELVLHCDKDKYKRVVADLEEVVRAGLCIKSEDMAHLNRDYDDIIKMAM